MRALLQYASWVIGLPLELLIIAALTRGSYRRFPFILAFSVALFLTTIVEIVRSAHYDSMTARIYWIDETVRETLLFALVINLIFQAISPDQSRVRTGVLLAAGSVLLAGTSFLIHYQPQALTGQWITLWLRDLDFSAAILDLGLWAVLLAKRRAEGTLLLLSGGLGILFTGEAMGQSLRHLFPWQISPGDVLVLLANLTMLWIWWQALRVAALPHEAPSKA